MQGLYWQKRLKQRNLFGDLVDVEFDATNQITWLIGDFFEELAVKQIGGKVELYDLKQRCFKNGFICPDLLDWEREVIYEVKGYGSRGILIIKPKQVANYLDLEKNKFPMTHPPTYYVIFEHRATDIPFEKRNTELTLWKALCKSVTYMLVVPTVLILELSKDKPLNSIKGREGAEYVRIKPREVKRFLFDPRTCIGDDYSWRFDHSRKCKMLKWYVSEFPIMWIWRDGQEPPKI